MLIWLTYLILVKLIPSFKITHGALRMIRSFSTSSGCLTWANVAIGLGHRCAHYIRQRSQRPLATCWRNAFLMDRIPPLLTPGYQLLRLPHRYQRLHHINLHHPMQVDVRLNIFHSVKRSYHLCQVATIHLSAVEQFNGHLL